MATFYTKWCNSGTSSPNSATYTIDGIKITYYNDVRFKYVVSERVNAGANTSTLVVDKYAIFYYTWDNYAHWLDVTSRSKIPSSASYKSETENIRSSSALDSYLWQYIGQDSFTVEHKEDGSGSTTFTGNGYYTGDSGKTYSKTVSGTISLTKINRASTVTTNATSSAGKKFGDAVTFSISRQESNFTHKLTYSSGGTTYTIGEDIGTSGSYTFPKSLVKNYPDAVKNGIVVTCTTYSGSVKIGTSKVTVYLNVPDEYVPTCSLAVEDVGNIPAGWNVWIKGKSILKGTITANGIEGSTIKSYSSKANDETFNINPFTTGLIKGNGEKTITSTITDSRNRTVTATQTINVIDYIPPTILMCKIDRCNADGTLNTDGTYGKATIEYKISPVSDLNAKSVKVTYGSIERTATLTDYEGTYTFEEVFSGLESNATYNFEFSVIDSFEEVPQSYTLPPSFVTISKLAGGKGVTFGQVATEEGLVSYMNTKLYKDNWFKNESIDGLKTEKVNGGWITYAEDED